MQGTQLSGLCGRKSSMDEIDPRYVSDLEKIIVKLDAKLTKTIEAIDEFCAKNRWSADIWKNQPHIKALFDISEASDE